MKFHAGDASSRFKHVTRMSSSSLVHMQVGGARAGAAHRGSAAGRVEVQH